MNYSEGGSEPATCSSATFKNASAAGVRSSLRLRIATSRWETGSMRRVRSPDLCASGAQEDGITAWPTPARTSGKIEVRCATSTTICVYTAGQSVIDQPAHQRPALACNQPVATQIFSLDGGPGPEGIGVGVHDQYQWLTLQLQHLNARDSDRGG